MYERGYGSKYHQTQGAQSPGGHTWLEASEIAKLMRTDIKAAKAAGELPADLKVSVTVENYSMGRSINMTVPFRPEYWQTCEGKVPGSESEDGLTARACGDVWCSARNDSPHAKSHEVLTVEGRRVWELLKAIHWAYNYDGSDSQTDYYDVNYGGSVTMQDEGSSTWAAEQAEKRSAARKNAAAKSELIDHLLAEHSGSLRYGAKKGNLRQWYSFERLTEVHDKMHAKTEVSA